MLYHQTKTIHVFLFILVNWIIGTLSTYNLKCPEYSQRDIRSHHCCPMLPSGYACLYMTENSAYGKNKTNIHEYCDDKPEFAGIGQKYVWSYGLRNIKCSSTSFQPPGTTLWKHVNGKCLYMKSFCNEEGQVIHNNGSTKEDVACRCDYAKGYNFVNITNKPDCKPFEEDCSCYVKEFLSNLTDEQLDIDYNYSASSDKNALQIPYFTRQSTVGSVDLIAPIKNHTITEDCCLKQVIEANLLYGNAYRVNFKIGITVWIVLFVITGCCFMIAFMLNDQNIKYKETSRDPASTSSDPKEQVNITNITTLPQNNDNTADNKVISEQHDCIDKSETLSDNLSGISATFTRNKYSAIKGALEKTFSDKTMYVSVSPSEVEEYAGFSCQFNANIMATNSDINQIDWLHLVSSENTIICDVANTDKYSTGNRQSLTILNLEPSDAGTYVCRVSNSETTICSEHVKLNVKEYTPKIVNKIVQCKIDNELITELEVTFDVPEPIAIYLLFKKNTEEIKSLPEEYAINESFITCYFLIPCSGKYKLVVETFFGAVHSQIIDLMIPLDGKDKRKEKWSVDMLKRNLQKDCNKLTGNTASNNNSAQNVDETQDLSTENTTENTDRTHYVVESHQLTINDQPGNTASNNNSTQNVDETQDLSTENTTENTDRTHYVAESHQLTINDQPESQCSNDDFKTSLKRASVWGVVALDIGTTHSRYAVLISEPLSCELKFKSVIEGALPTAVLFEATTGTSVACGNEAKTEYISAIHRGERESYLMFERFKSELYKRMEITGEMEIKDRYGRPILAIDVYTAMINDLKERALAHTNQMNNISDNIVWVMTVPDVWNKHARDFIQLSCERCGITKQQLFIEDESNAILTYFQNDQYFCGEPFISQNLDDNNYLLIDLGGGTCDITGYLTTTDCDVGVPIQSTHISCGVDIVCDALLDRISSMIGDRAMDYMKGEEIASFIQLREACLQLCEASDNIWNIPIRTLDKLCKRFRLMSFKDTVDVFGKSASRDSLEHVDIDFTMLNDKLIVRKGLVEDCFKVVVKTIIMKIKHILTTQKAQNIQQFFIVGGFSSLSIVQNEIQDAFKDKSINFANDKVFSSVKGALVYGYEKTRI